MSNARRIWIGYLIGLCMPAMMFAPAVAATMLGANDTTVGASAASGLVVGIIVWTIYSNQVGKCWRCRETLSRGPGGWFYPIVFWRSCRSCGVKHRSAPDDVRRNPLGPFR